MTQNDDSKAMTTATFQQITPGMLNNVGKFGFMLNCVFAKESMLSPNEPNLYLPSL